MWTETEKAFWILQNGEPKVAWVFERNGDKIYRRPFADPGSKLPPWISTERELVSNMLTGKTYNSIIFDEITNEHRNNRSTPI